MLDLLTIVLPVFGLIGIGYIARRTGFVSDKAGDGRGYGAVIGMVVIAGRSDDEIEIPASCDLAAQRAITAPRDRGQLAIGQIEERDVASNDAETT